MSAGRAACSRLPDVSGAAEPHGDRPFVVSHFNKEVERSAAWRKSRELVAGQRILLVDFERRLLGYPHCHAVRLYYIHRAQEHRTASSGNQCSHGR